MVDSLLKFAAKKVASGFANGNYLNEDFQLVENQSHAVFEYLTTEVTPVPPWLVPEVIKKLKLSMMKIKGKELTDDTFEIAFDQDLTHLELTDLSSSTLFDEVNEDGIVMNIAFALESLLNTKSQQVLKELVINGDRVTFLENWISEIHQLVPSVNSLSLPHCTLTSLDFTNLCNSFTSITKLDISHSGVKKLTGIGNIPNLILLNLVGLVFERKEDIMDIFNLLKLEILNISFYEDEVVEQNLKLYLLCNKSLPELILIDCSYCNIDKQDLCNLVETHQKLQMVNLVGTELEDINKLKFPARTIEFLNTETVPSCIRSLQYHMNTWEIDETVVIEILDIILSKISDSDPTDRDKNELLKLLISLIDDKYENDIREKSFECLMDAIGKTSHIDSDVKCLITRTMLSIPMQMNPEGEEDLWRNAIFGKAWHVLCASRVSDPSTIDFICERAGDVLKRFEKMESDASFACLSFLEAKLRGMTPKKGAILTEDHSLKSHIISLLSNCAHPLRATSVHIFLKVICDLTHLSNHSCSEPASINVDRECMRAMIKKMGEYNRIMYRTVDQFEEYVKLIDISAYDVFFEPSSVAVLTSFLLAKNERQRRTISILHTMMDCVVDKRQFDQYYYDGVKKIRVSNISKSIQPYRKAEGADDLDLFRFIVSTSEFDDAINFAKWFLRGCGVELGGAVEEQEPAEKRRRV